MYLIGEFSNILKISTRTLRYYEKIGLLKPFFVDSKTKYRYYSEEQFSDFLMIAEFKKLGFTLKDINNLLKSKTNSDFQKILEEKYQDLKKEKNKLETMIHGLNKVIERIENKEEILQIPRAVNIKIEERKAITVYAKRKKISLDDLDLFIDEFIDEIDALKIKMREPIISIYYYDGDIEKEYLVKEEEDIELCVEVLKQTNNNALPLKILPGGKYATIIHVGSEYRLDEYDRSIEAYYRYLITWIHQNHYHIAGIPLEVMLKKGSGKDPDNESILKICIPIEEK